MMKLASLLVVSLLVAACSSQTVEPSYYLLRPTSELQTRELIPSNEYAMGNVIVSSYVDQQGLLLETRAGEIRPARHHLWAEPMFESLRTFLILEISRAKGRDIVAAKYAREATAVDIRIDQLHGTNDGKAVLAAYWWLRKGDKILSAYQYAETRVLSRDGYGALADAQKALLTDLSTRIAATLVEPSS